MFLCIECEEVKIKLRYENNVLRLCVVKGLDPLGPNISAQFCMFARSGDLNYCVIAFVTWSDKASKGFVSK